MRVPDEGLVGEPAGVLAWRPGDRVESGRGDPARGQMGHYRKLPVGPDYIVAEVLDIHRCGPCAKKRSARVHGGNRAIYADIVVQGDVFIEVRNIRRDPDRGLAARRALRRIWGAVRT